MNKDIGAKIEQIQLVFPDKIETIDIDEKGEDYRVIEINQEWIFRFPRNDYGLHTLPVQQKFLPLFARISPLPIPEPRFISPEFFGYRKINGKLLTSELFKTLSLETRNVIAQQIGSFLSAIHAFPLDQVRSLGATESWGGWRVSAARKFKQDVMPSLSAEARKNASRFLDEFFSMKYSPMLIHGDFYPPDHVFFDEQKQRLSGVIDFGDLTIEDIAIDFKSIYLDFGEDFYQLVLSYYSGKIDLHLVDRIKVRAEAHPIFDAVYALEYKQPERFKRDLVEIEMRFG